MDIVCPLAKSGTFPLGRTAFWGSQLHHGDIFHKFIAVILAHVIYEYATTDITETSLDEHLPTWMPNQTSITKKQISEWNEYVDQNNASSGIDLGLDAKTLKCSTYPLQVYLPVKRYGKDWSYYEDVPGKPGWISTYIGDQSSGKSAINPLSQPDASLSALLSHDADPRSITFQAKLNAVEPIIRLAVLMSYDRRMGVLKCCVDSYDQSFCQSINTKWDDETSQMVSEDLSFPSLPDRNERAVVRRDVTCYADSGKIKIISARSC